VNAREFLNRWKWDHADGLRGLLVSADAPELASGEDWFRGEDVDFVGAFGFVVSGDGATRRSYVAFSLVRRVERRTELGTEVLWRRRPR